MKTAIQELIEKIQYSIDVQSGVSLTETQVNTLKAVMLVAERLLEKEKEQIENKLGVVEIKQIISSTTGTKLTISEKHDLAVAIFEKLGGEVKSYIDEETKSEIVNKLTKKWNSGNQNK
jgi:hypothetical protein